MRVRRGSHIMYTMDETADIKTCVVCATGVRQRQKHGRCRACIAAARGRCRCGAEVVDAGGYGSGKKLCEACKAMPVRQRSAVRGLGSAPHVCVACGAEFVTFASEIHLRRCIGCRVSGLRRCPICGLTFTDTVRRVGGSPRCPACAAAPQRRHTDGHWDAHRGALPGARVTLACQGVDLYGKNTHAGTCQGSRVFLESYATGHVRGLAHGLRTYRAADATYICAPCMGLQRMYVDLPNAIAADPERYNQDEEFLDRIGKLAPSRRNHGDDDGDDYAFAGESFNRPKAAAGVAQRVDSRIRSKKTAAAILSAWGQSQPLMATGRTAAATPVRKRQAPISWRIIAGRWRKGVHLTVRQCLGCGQLLIQPTAPAARQVEMHYACRVEATRTAQARAWAAERRRRQARGETATAINRATGYRLPITPVPRRGDSVVLTRQFRWTVLHFLGGDTLEVIALEAGVTRQAVHKAVRHILSLLPDDVADKRFRRVVDLLRQAAATGGRETQS